MVRPSGQHSFASAINTFGVRSIVFAMAIIMTAAIAHADSVNSPNITMNVDTNRAIGSGNGAVGTSVVVNTITLAEITLPEYSSGTGKSFSIQARPGFQFDPTSSVTAQSATIGINGGGLNAVATVVPTGAANEIITFNLTSGTNVNVQDIIRINGIRVRILSAAGAAGPAQTTLQLTTTTAGGAFTNQGIVATNITVGAPDRLVFSIQPGDVQAGFDILPAVRIVDFGGNAVTNSNRNITLAIQNNPGATTLNGILQKLTGQGVATWQDEDDLNITVAAAGYTLRASHDGAAFLTSDTVDSTDFDVTSGPANRMEISTQPVTTPAGDAIELSVTVFDDMDNIVTGSTADITLDSAVNTGGWPLLVDSSLTKTTVNGVATWNATDNLRINKAVADYQLSASGAGDPVFTDFFDIVPADPAAVRFAQQPSNVDQDAAIDPAVTVEITDEFGNLTDSTALVNLELVSDCGGQLAGAAENGVAGLATFGALSIDTPCENAILRATSGSFPTVDSDPFSILAVVAAGGADACGACGTGAAPMTAVMVLLLVARPRRRGNRGRRHRCASDV